MPSLEHSLDGQDLAYLHSVADMWRVELDAPDARRAASHLAAIIASAIVRTDELPAACVSALQILAASGGRSPWLQFVRRHGQLREMGAARIEKERPQRTPVSVTEQLWYRGLIGRAFFETPEGPVEFAYMPDEVLAVFPINAPKVQAFGRPARPAERSVVRWATDTILDEVCSLLAALRTGRALQEAAELEGWQIPLNFMQALLQAAGLLDSTGKVNANAARIWLELERGAALQFLVRAWLHSVELNELRLLPGVLAEGNWQNDPKATRQQLLDWLHRLPQTHWWSLAAFLSDVKQHAADFQRPAGDFDSWYLRDQEGKFLRGFAHWDAVDGALVQYALQGPMHWLGLLDLAASSEVSQPLAFRWSAWADDLLAEQAPALPAEKQKLKVVSSGQISAARLTPRAIRYQVARFCDWHPPRKGNYQYQISAAGLLAARQQGLQASQLLALLQAQVGEALPPNLPQALRRWQEHGPQAQLGVRTVLRLQSAAALKALRASRAARWLGELLGPLAIEVKPGASHQVLQALLELGYLGELEEQA